MSQQHILEVSWKDISFQETSLCIMATCDDHDHMWWGQSILPSTVLVCQNTWRYFKKKREKERNLKLRKKKLIMNGIAVLNHIVRLSDICILHQVNETDFVIKWIQAWLIYCASKLLVHGVSSHENLYSTVEQKTVCCVGWSGQSHALSWAPIH